MWWNIKKVAWYERASKLSSFHRELTDIIEKYVKKDESIVEFGSGTGHVGELLYHDGYDITSLDIEKRPIIIARKRSGLDIYKKMSYRSWNEKRDTALMIFFGKITERNNLEKIFKIVDKVIYIQNEHKGQNEDSASCYEDNTSKTISFLESSQYSFSYEKFVLPFPQPLKDRKDAEDFIVSTYGVENLDYYLKYVEDAKTVDKEDCMEKLRDDKIKKEYPLIFKNDKHITMFVITKPN